MLKPKNSVSDESPILNDKEAKFAAVQQALAKIEKEYGKGAVMSLGTKSAPCCEKLSSGILPLDMAIGIGGFPKGRIIEIFGPESAGKTLIALQTAAETQRIGGIVAYIDVEHALNVEFSKKIGVDVDSLLVCQPDSGEQALAITEQLVRSGGIDLIVVDSVAALTPEAEIEGDMGDSHVGLLARLMSQGLRKLTSVVSKTNTTVIFINQLREKIGVLYGNPETTPGGRALKFYASVRLDVRKKEAIKDGTNVIGNRVHIKVVKNKVAPPFKECEFEILFDSGVSKEGSAVDIATDLGILDKSGSWYAYDGEKIGQGRQQVAVYFKNNPKIFEEIIAKIYAKSVSPEADPNV